MDNRDLQSEITREIFSRRNGLIVKFSFSKFLFKHGYFILSKRPIFETTTENLDQTRIARNAHHLSQSNGNGIKNQTTQIDPRYIVEIRAQKSTDVTFVKLSFNVHFCPERPVFHLRYTVKWNGISGQTQWVMGSNAQTNQVAATIPTKPSDHCKIPSQRIQT